MVQLKLTKITSSSIASTPFVIGQIIYCTDSKKSYYDHTNGQRYNGVETSLVIGDTYTDLESNSKLYMNKVYIDLSTGLFYKFNFKSVQFEAVYTDLEFVTIISQSVALEGYTLEDIKAGKYLAPVTTSSNVTYDVDGTTKLDEILASDLYITNTSGAYVEARNENQRVFKIPFPVAKYSLYRDHMTVVRNVSGNLVLMGTSTYKVNNGYIVINDDEPGVPKGDKVLFMFYYTRTTNLNQSQVIDTNNIMDGSITIEKIDPFIKIPISMIEQSEDAQTVSANEKALIHAFEHFTITEVDADIVNENASRMFVDEGMYNLLYSMLQNGGTDPNVIAYIHPDAHPASMILLRDLATDLEQYSRILEDRWENTQALYSGDISIGDLDDILLPGNYTIKKGTLDKLLNLPIEGDSKLEVETSNGLKYELLEGEWITQRIIHKDDKDILRIFYRGCGNAVGTFSEWSEVLTTTTGQSELLTNSKEIIGAINEVFQFANDGKAKWLDVIGYPLDKFDKFTNLYEKTKIIKQKLVDLLIANGITCTIDTTLQDLIASAKNIIDLSKPKKGDILSSATMITFTSTTSSFDSFYIEVKGLFINIDVLNIYKDGLLYASIKDGVGIYSIGNLNKVFTVSTDGAYLNTGFRIPVELDNVSYSYYASAK